jgi:hypothetical protein
MNYGRQCLTYKLEPLDSSIYAVLIPRFLIRQKHTPRPLFSRQLRYHLSNVEVNKSAIRNKTPLVLGFRAIALIT